MADRPERPERPERPRGRKGRRKVCSFCVDKIDTIDYKDVARLRRFRVGAGQDPAPPRHRHLCPASAGADRGDQTCPADRPDALCKRLTSS